MDTLVSRNRGEVFFLDQLMLTNNGSLLATKLESSEAEEEEQQPGAAPAAQRDGRNKKQISRKPSIDTFANKRYGGSLFRPTETSIDHCVDERNISDRIFDLNYIRSFLEFHNPFSKPPED